MCSVCGARDVTEQSGAFADRYPHHYENGECIYCYAHEEGPTDRVRPRNPNLNQLPAQIRNRTSAKRRNIRRNEYA